MKIVKKNIFPVTEKLIQVLVEWGLGMSNNNKVNEIWLIFNTSADGQVVKVLYFQAEDQVSILGWHMLIHK